MSLIGDYMPSLLAFVSGVLVGRLIYLDKPSTPTVSLPDENRRLNSPEK